MPNIWAVIVSAIIAMIIGSIWWGPLFGKMWMRENGFDQMSPEQREAMKKGMASLYIQQLILSLIQAYVLAHIIIAFSKTMPGISGLSAGLQGGFWAWLGFMLPVQYGQRIWGRKGFKFVAATLGSSLVTLLVIGVILGIWR